MRKTFWKLMMTIVMNVTMLNFSVAQTKPLKADLIIKNGTVLTMNAQHQIFEKGVVVIKGNKILAVGNADLLKNYQSPKILDVKGDIVMPGLINTHTHASMTVFRSLADDVPDRLHRYMFPLEKKLVSPEMVRIGADLANVEMLKGGVTTYADMYYFEDEVAKTVDKIGMRAVLGETVIKFPVGDSKNAKEGLAYAIKFIKQYKNHPRITPAFAPHAPYTNSTEDLQKIAKLSIEMDVPMLIHLAETQREKDAIAKRTNGKTPVQYMAEIGALNNKVVAAHAIHLNDNDIALLKKHSVGIAHNIGANTKSANGIAPVVAMLKQGIAVGLGTDGPMSSNTLSTMNVLNLVGKFHKLANKDRMAMPAIEVVKMATIGSAKVLQMDDKIGSLETNKLADIIVVDTQAPHMNPMYDPYSALVYGANANDVKHAIVDGKILMQDRKLTTVDEKQIIQTARAFEQKVRATITDIGEVVE